tara:strand:- start:147 stop:908 length:762 start_codon:yes stop_codon:yes gene_type:complete
MKTKINAIILAAGVGNRLSPLTKDIPKGMVKLFEKSLLEMQIDIFKQYDINDITIVTGYLGEKITFPDINYIKNKNFSLTNINESLFCAREKFQTESLISYSDIIYEKKNIERIANFNGDIGVGIRLNWKPHYKGRTLHPTSEAENVVIENNKIVKIQKNISKCEKNQTVGEFLGLMKLSKNASDILVQKYLELEKSHKGKFHNAPSLKQAYITDMLQEIIDSDYLVEPIIIEGKWCEIDTMQDIEYARRIFK